MSQVFISFSEENSEFALIISLVLEKNGYATWNWISAQKPGVHWESGIDKAISASFALIVIMSPEAKNSEHVIYEWSYALGAKIPVIPISYKPTEPHPRLKSLHHLDFTALNAAYESIGPWPKLIDKLKEEEEAKKQKVTSYPANNSRPTSGQKPKATSYPQAKSRTASNTNLQVSLLQTASESPALTGKSNGVSQQIQQNGKNYHSQQNGYSQPSRQNSRSNHLQQNGNPSHDPYSEKSADELYRSKNYADARIIYNILLRKPENSSNAVLQRKMGDTLKGLGEKQKNFSDQKKLYSEAIIFYKKAIDLQPNLSEAYIGVFECYQLLNDNESVVEALNTIIQRFSKDIYGYKHLCKHYMVHDDYEQALAISEKMRLDFPKNVIGHLNAGIALFHLNKFDQALPYIEQALTFDPKNAQAYCYQGRIYAEYLRLDDTLTAYQERQLCDSALDAFNKAITYRTGNAAAYFYKGLLLKQQERMKEAQEALDKAFLYNPELKKLYYAHP